MVENATGSYKAAFAQVQEMIQARQFEPALSQIKAILEVFPKDAKVNFLKASVFRNLGRHTEALALLLKLSKATDGGGLVHQELGFTYFALQRIDQAVAALRKAVEINPKLTSTWQLLGELLYQEDNEEAAESAFLNQITYSHRHPGILKAVSLVNQERYGMAEGICKDYLQRYPDDVTVLRLLAEIGIKLGIRHDPELLLEHCLKLAPDYHLARNTYANALSKAQKYDQALQEINHLEKVDPENLSHRVLAASVQVMIGDYEAAADRYADLVKRVPNYAQLHTSYGHALKTLGRTSQAITAYRKAIKVRAELGEAYWSLANLKTFEFEPTDIDQMRAVIAGANYSLRDFIHLCFALGKALEDNHQFDESFEYYAKGNEAKNKQEQYLSDDTRSETKALITTCSSKLFSDKKGFGLQAADPIFIVGLPRSGSTLLEQILASHSQVDGTSELREMISIARRLGGKRNRDDVSQYPGILWQLSEQQCHELGGEYLERTRIQRQNAPFFIDKMPNNFQHVGLINLLLPNAKIIDARRHPMATCFSGFKQLFAAGQPFTYSQPDLARYYSDYARLMDHWDQVLPGRVLRVNYENIVANTRYEVRRLLDYCKLPFEDACLAFHNTQRPIRTASSEQVRQPIYTQGLDQWRNFSHHLGPLETELGGLINQYEQQIDGPYQANPNI